MTSNILVLSQGKSTASGGLLLARVNASSDVIEFTATGGNLTYFARLTNSDIKSLVRNSDDRWIKTFRDILLGLEYPRRTEMLATLRATSISVLIRESQDLPLKICTFEVPVSEEVEISLLLWAGEAADALQEARANSRILENELATIHGRNREAQAQVSAITSIQKSHETLLLGKFLTLLNSKKQTQQEQRKKHKFNQLGEKFGFAPEESDQIASGSPGLHNAALSSAGENRDHSSSTEDGDEEL